MTEPSYLGFRLGTIALEEVGPGDWNVVGEVLGKIRDRKHVDLPDLAARLASSPKSRTVVYAKHLPPADTLDLDPLARFLTSYGQGFEKLGQGVPHVMKLVAESQTTEIVVNPPDEFGDVMIAGLPAATFDQHTREGKSAIAYFKACLRTEFTSDQVAWAVFAVEGQYIGPRELVFDGSDALRIESVEAGFRKRGITARDAMLDLSELVKQNRGALNHARKKVLA